MSDTLTIYREVNAILTEEEPMWSKMTEFEKDALLPIPGILQAIREKGQTARSDTDEMLFRTPNGTRSPGGAIAENDGAHRSKTTEYKAYRRLASIVRKNIAAMLKNGFTFGDFNG